MIILFLHAKGIKYLSILKEKNEVIFELFYVEF